MFQSKEFLLQREKWIPRPLEEVFAFFADAGNLEAITPPWLRFEILPPKPAVLAAGAILRYRLGWHGLSIRWVTEIQVWDPPHRFVDVQLRGPYRLWHHTHEFQGSNGRTLMRDSVRYALPLGTLGALAHAWFVRADLRAIFDYRETRVSELVGGVRDRG